MIEGGGEIAIDNWPVLIGNVDQRTAKGIMNNIGHVDGLCHRAGLEAPPDAPIVTREPAAAPHTPSPAQSLPTSSFHPQPSPISSPTATSAPSADDAFLPAPAPIRPAYVAPLTTAEEEKQAYYERATASRDRLQASLAISSPTATERTRDSGTTESFARTAEEDNAAYHQAAVLRRSVIQSDQTDADNPLVARATLSPTRSNTTRAFSGSSVGMSSSSTPPPPLPTTSSSSPAAAFLGRTLTTAESEKRAMFNQARETAARRQEEARLELERSNAFLEGAFSYLFFPRVELY
jgi:hypothetical protein